MLYISFMDTRDDLIKWNERGLILGPDESEESFFKRCQQAKAASPIPSSLAKRVYDISPDWIAVKYSNKGLYFWEGGCTWINKSEITLQLNKAFEKKETYLGLYTREELMTHELLHVARQAFEEPVFEEILAYQTSKSLFRRLFGPIFRTSKETRFFLTSFFVCFFAALFSPFPKIFSLALVGFVGVYFFRLLRAQLIFTRTRKKLAPLVGENKALPVMVRLTDREIIRFSKKSEQEIYAYAQKLSKTHLRWKQIFFAYFA